MPVSFDILLAAHHILHHHITSKQLAPTQFLTLQTTSSTGEKLLSEKMKKIEKEKGKNETQREREENFFIFLFAIVIDDDK